MHYGDRVFAGILKIPAAGLALLLLSIAYFLYRAASPVIVKHGWAFLTSSTWDPVRDVYGALPVIYGTVVSSFIAIVIATPLSVGVALFLTEIAPRRTGRVFGFLVEMLAAIPSVVYGLWGIFVLAPWLRTSVEPFFKTWLGFLPFFSGPPYGVGMLAAGIILAVMITPTISSIAREVFSAIPLQQREAALGIGATRWEMMRLAVLQSSRRGLTGAVILGLGRALGETMAVTMIIGNRHEVSLSLFAPGSTMASIIANEYAEATTDTHVAALVEVGLVLFAVTFVINSIARLFLSRSGNR
ncbi:MAG: phosphate ABC transporter permease subunit PstC [Deltaproteobacteria bacterium]|nr:phosphate ABC transporter permease subunit PstC [Deltaproteobacteria bacterium]